MKIKQMQNNQFKIEVNENLTLFQSYESIVAGWFSGRGFIINKMFYKFSKTTTKYTCEFVGANNSKHLHNLIKNEKIELVNDEVFDGLVKQYTHQ